MPKALTVSENRIGQLSEPESRASQILKDLLTGAGLRLAQLIKSTQSQVKSITSDKFRDL